MSKIEDMELKSKHTSEKNEAVVSFHNISYKIKIPPTCFSCCRDAKEIEILKDVSGMMKQGLNAIMGPTGSGKSSLLDILAKRKDPKWLNGRVMLNAQKLPSNYRYQCGYVVQNDILMGTLSVRECLWFSANLRLPTTVPHSEKKTRVAEILEQLGLQKCADTKIGNEIIRGVSGGERKRTSIGLELITKPSVLFLDEPTTGLDASTANVVMRLLKKLTMQGQTIVISIHQPRFSIFKLFDSLTLLSLGQCVYHGDANEALPYFQGIGYECETHNNPADFFLDVINGEVETNNQVDQIEFADEETKHEREIKITDSLHKSYLESEEHMTLREELEVSKVRDSTVSFPDTTNVYSTRFFTQLKYLTQRDFSNNVRDPEGVLANVFANIVLGIVFGILYYKVDDTADTGAQNRIGLLFLIVVNTMFSANDAITLFTRERNLFICEYVSGYYSVIAYFISKLAADIIPIRSIAPIVFGATMYWMVGLRQTVGAVFIFMLVVAQIGYASVAIGTFLSTTFNNYTVANLALILVYIFAMVFSGLLVNLNSIVVWLRWIQYLSPSRFALVAVAVNEFSGQLYELCNNDTCSNVSGDYILHETMSIGSSANDINAWDLWQNILALGIFTLGMLLLTYVQLVRCKKYS